MATDDIRPSPETLLAETQKHRRGKLRIFLGMAPGVGKTYQMLIEAHQRKEAGLDILIGWVDTHKREETAKLLEGLEILPRRQVARRHTFVEALDIDEILRRKPAVVVIDEMPHSNPPGSRHAKRWQDIEEILDMGIDVWSALNIQHLESLNGVVERVTGVPVTETVPDRIFDQADEVRLIDLPPDDLLSRLNAGKIYLPKIVERAKDSYFKKSNLVALRELALRSMANRMESQIRSARQRSTRRVIEDTNYGLLFALEEISEDAIREVSRIARALSSPWHVVWMEGFGSDRGDSETVSRLLKFAQELGAKTDVLAGNYGQEVTRYAREHNLSIVALLPNGLFHANRRRQIERFAPELNVITLPIRYKPTTTLLAPIKKFIREFDFGFEGYWQSLIAILLIVCVLYPFHHLIDPTNAAMLYLVVVLFCGVRYGSGPAATAAIMAVIAFDYTIIEPQLSLKADDSQYIITFAVMLIVGLVAGQLVAHRQELAVAANKREHQTRMLFETSSELSQLLTPEDALSIISETLKHHLDVDCEFWRPIWDSEESKRDHPETVELERYEPILKGVDTAIVRWCYEHRQDAGFGTHTLASSPYWYIPLESGNKVLAVIVVRFPEKASPNDITMRRLIEAVVSLGAQTLLRIESTSEARQTLVSMEAERLRYSLIQSLSHDLRTPITILKLTTEALTSKLDAVRAEGLHSPTGKVNKTVFREFAPIRRDVDYILDGATRMERLVVNLLEMARLQTGNIELKQTWIPAAELFEMCISELGDRLKPYALSIHIDEECPLVYADPVLVTRVLANLLDNAVKYCPAGSKIVCSARKRGDTVVVSVADNGPGLPEENTQRLFDPFRRGQKDAHITGVGLGLAICRTIIRAHDGEIFATPSSMGGACFTITLPYVDLDDEMDALDDELLDPFDDEADFEPLPLAALTDASQRQEADAGQAYIISSKRVNSKATEPKEATSATTPASEAVDADGKVEFKVSDTLKKLAKLTKKPLIDESVVQVLAPDKKVEESAPQEAELPSQVTTEGAPTARPASTMPSHDAPKVTTRKSAPRKKGASVATRRKATVDAGTPPTAQPRSAPRKRTAREVTKGEGSPAKAARTSRKRASKEATPEVAPKGKGQR